MVVSAYLSLAFMAIALLLLLGACWVVVRGLGGITALRSDVIVLQTGLEKTDERITREVKTRAGQARAEIAADERSIQEQAAAHLAEQTNVTALPERPKRPMRRRL